MDLDKIKYSWNKLDIPAGTDECAVKDIIKGKAKTVLDRLIMTETFLLFIILPLLSVPFVIDYLLEGIYVLPAYIKYPYLIFCVISFFWQGYKRLLLKQIDIANNGILDNRKYFLRYKLYIKYEIVVGATFGLLLYIGIVYSWKDVMTDYQFEIYCWVNLILCLSIVLSSVYFYRRIYYRQIKKIESSLDEIENMERE